MANMRDVLIAVELAISLRFGAFVLKWTMKNIVWVFWTVTPYVFVLPMHLMLVLATPLVAFYTCVADKENTQVLTQRWGECVDASGMLEIYPEFLNPDTMQQDLGLIRSSMDLVYNGSLIMLHRALGNGIFPIVGA